MARRFYLATIADNGGSTAAVVVGDDVHPVPGRTSMAELLDDWDSSLERLDGLLERGDLKQARPLAETRLLAPLPRPANLYMTGANYADHAREMRGLGPDDDVPRPAEGPFIFLKPTTTVIGPLETVLIGAGCGKVDWEVELAVVIGRRAHNVSTADALAHVAGYTVANDISVRDRFRRENTEAPMTFDWFAQKGWETSCPLGPWLLPARDCSDPGDLALSLIRNDAIEQESRTSEMLFSVEEQIAYISSLVPLVPGDVICTGTPAGVGMGKDRFLAPGDTMVAEVESIGRLENPVGVA